MEAGDNPCALLAVSFHSLLKNTGPPNVHRTIVEGFLLSPTARSTVLASAKQITTCLVAAQKGHPAGERSQPFPRLPKPSRAGAMEQMTVSGVGRGNRVPSLTHPETAFSTCGFSKSAGKGDFQSYSFRDPVLEGSLVQACDGKP